MARPQLGFPAGLLEVRPETGVWGTQPRVDAVKTRRCRRFVMPMRFGTRSRRKVSCSSRLKEAAPIPSEVPVVDSQAAT
ncbi:MAG: hypothetical protein NTX53_18910, partial [candidate division WOR-3 bacterium]|nr:hypothetical protein [candidate division WOR-3 bacterium]